MSDLSASKLEGKKHWTLTPKAFEGLLNWLDSGVNSEGEKYLEMRRRLVAYFDRKGCQTSNDLADETLNRVARRLEEENLVQAETPPKYCYIVARFVFLESLRNAERHNARLDDIGPRHHSDERDAPGFEDQKQVKEKMLICLEECTEKLEPVNREIIIRYYKGSARSKIEGRRALAQELGISVNALSIRACRIRDRLEACVKECAAAK
jgi:DNA-directed RNA polymerase specialized sigma24 family protein